MSEPLFESHGMTARRKRSLTVCAYILIGLGGLSLLLLAIAPRSLYATLGLLMVFTFGFGALILGRLPNDYTNKSKLVIYDDHIDAVPVSGQAFQLPIQKINDIHVMKSTDDMLLISTSETTYTVIVNNVDHAYSILCDLVFGKG